MEQIVKHLEDELKKSNTNLESLMDEYSKLEDTNRDLLLQKVNIIGETANFKAKTNFLKKEIEIRRSHLDEIMKSHNTRISEVKQKKLNKIKTCLSEINNLIAHINNRKDIKLEKISEELLYIIN
jgi:chromosome segregation ATPase